MIDNLLDDHWILDAGDDLDRAFALLTLADVNAKHPLETPGPLNRMFRCREAQGCARAARSWQRAVPLGYGHRAQYGSAWYFLRLYPAWPE